MLCSSTKGNCDKRAKSLPDRNCLRMGTTHNAAFLCPQPITPQRKRGRCACSAFLGSRPVHYNHVSLPSRRRAGLRIDYGHRITPKSQHDHPRTNRNYQEPSRRDVYFATCARGLGEVLAREIKSEQVNGEVLDVASSGVRFVASEPNHITGYRACIWLRTAMRVLLEVAHQQIHPEDTTSYRRNTDLSQAVYEFVKDSADWSRLLDGGLKSFSIQVRVSEDTSNRKQQFSGRAQRGARSERERAPKFSALVPSEHTVQVRAKDAICDALRDAGFEKPPKPESHGESDVPLFITLHGSSITCYLDMAGASLHKRGYRSDGAMHRSSLNESVAAGMLYMAGFQPDGSFVSTKKENSTSGTPRGPLTIVDPMCGSGTLLIEAALLRLRVAVGLYRKRFAFQTWVDFDDAVFQQLLSEAVGLQRSDDDVSANFIGNDINPSALALARRDLERTRLANIISLHHADARELALPAPPTLTISNPPWGMRLGGEIMAWECMGKFLREYAGGCTAVFLSGDAGVTRGLRMKARKRMPVRIGNVDTRVLIYDVLPKRKDGERHAEPSDKQRNEGRHPRSARVSKLPESEMPIL